VTALKIPERTVWIRTKYVVASNVSLSVD